LERLKDLEQLKQQVLKEVEEDFSHQLVVATKEEEERTNVMNATLAEQEVAKKTQLKQRAKQLWDKEKQSLVNASKKEILQKIRGLANKEKGYWIGSLDDSSIEHALYGNLEVTGDKIVLMSDGFYDYYSQNTTKSFEELIAMRKQSTELDPIYGKKDDASILVIEL